MKQVAWCTDLHLNFTEPERGDEFLRAILSHPIEQLWIGGDIAEATDIDAYLIWLHHQLPCEIYFVLGNHDFYGGSIRSVREQVTALCEEFPRLHFLTNLAAPIPVAHDIGLVGHDGWADAREGNYASSLVMMNDYQRISELAPLSKADRQQMLFRLGDEAAAAIDAKVRRALVEFSSVYVLTHVPPLRQACWYNGKISDDEWAPHFVCQAIGTALLRAAADFPNRRIQVLCGHTHGDGICEPVDNLKIITGGATYGEPRIAKILKF